MRKCFLVLMVSVLVCGCESIRFAPGELQKQNAWLHNRTAAAAAEEARTEGTSQKLQSLAQLSELQSRAFVSYYGLPKEYPAGDTVEQILSQGNFQLADSANKESLDRPDIGAVAGNIFDLAIGLSALLGGVYGAKAAGFLKQAKAKSQALQEIIAGNELFKKQNADSVEAFKQAQSNQSAQTRQLVAELK